VILYRIVRTNPPTLADFTSNEAAGKPRPSNDPEAIRLWNGISAFATETQARNKALDFPFLGRYISVLDIEEGGSVPYQRTGLRSPGHHTLWGEPSAILARVVATFPVLETTTPE
jgi:hypothetical protein